MFSSSYSDSIKACWKDRDIVPIRHSDSDRSIQKIWDTLTRKQERQNKYLSTKQKKHIGMCV
jgi:predicted AlkP superfamily phosphohydrolase/phosphomutase